MQDKSASSGAFKDEDVLNQELSGELHKRIIRKFERRKVYSPFIENVLSVDFADMILISNFNKGICFYHVFLVSLLNTHEFFLLKDKKCITITNAFLKLLDESNREQTKYR